MSRPMLTPLGAARAKLGAPATRDLPAFPEDLAAIARAADLGEERLHLAWELARLVPAAALANGDAWRGLLVLLLLLFDAIAQGSTRLVIAGARDPQGANGRAALRERAAALGLSRADVRRAEACADVIALALETGASAAGGQLALSFDPRAPTSIHGELVGLPGTFRPLIFDGGALAPQRLVAIEERLAGRLLARAPAPLDPSAIERALASVLADPVRGARGTIALTAEQQQAVVAALRGPITVISGGPGTGKTSIVVSILRALARIDPAISIALAAPTGKAADRLAQSIRGALELCADPIDLALRERLPAARTLHRLLGWSPSDERFRHHEGSPLTERVVIVDEASMIDLAMMEHVAAALRPEALLILLGDADQLPSVDPGAVLADLVLSGGASTIHITRLTQSHRMDPSDPAGSHILGIARRVNAGEIPVLTDAPLETGAITRLRAPSSDGSVSPGVVMLEPRDAASREGLLAWWWEHRVRGDSSGLVDRTFDPSAARDAPLLQRLFDRLDSARLLCVTRGRPTGADAINAWMGARAARERRVPFSSLLLAGEPVMVVRNDYEKGLFNGDQGLVLWVSEGGLTTPRPALVVRRGTEYLSYRLETVRALLERAYATTVHKAQGSEHDAVALVLPDEDVPRLMTREILYTAITRARRSVLLVGSASLLGRAITRPGARTTALAARLAPR